MTSVAYGIAFPASRGILSPPALAPPLDLVSGVTISGAWGIEWPWTSSASGARLRVRDTVTSSEQDCADKAAALSFLGGHAGAVVSLYDHSGNARTMTNATAASQPAFTASHGSKSIGAAVFDATDDKLGVASALSTFFSASTGYMLVCVRFAALTANNAQAYQNQAIVSHPAEYLGLYGKSGGTAQAYLWDTGARVATATIAAATDHIVRWRHAGGNIYCAVDDGAWSSPVTAGDVGQMTGTGIGFGKYGSSAIALNAAVYGGFFASDVPAQEAAVIANLLARIRA